jgi:Ca-activated chloride channel homolog
VSFAWPAALLGLLAVPVAVAAYVVARRRPSRYAVSYPNLELLASVTRPGSRRRALPAALFAVSAVAMLVAIARPQARVLVPREDATVVLVMDRSGSMSAEDVDPSRLAAARSSAKAFTEVVPGRFRLGVVAFSDVADVIRTPTTDRDSVERAIDSLEPNGGTAIGDAILRALRVIDQAGAAGGGGDGSLSAILLLSDGASTSGVDPDEAARRARAAHVPVFTIALGGGTSAGVVTTPDLGALRRIARTTGARAFVAPTQEDLTRIYEELGSRLGFEWRREEVTAAFALGAAALLVASVASALRRRAALP